MNLRFHLFILVLFSLLIQSCDPDRVYETNIRIPDGIWSQENVIKFEVMIEDTSSSHNLFVNVRNTSLYPTSNLSPVNKSSPLP